jgi:hypothetical protein
MIRNLRIVGANLCVRPLLERKCRKKTQINTTDRKYRHCEGGSLKQSRVFAVWIASPQAARNDDSHSFAFICVIRVICVLKFLWNNRHHAFAPRPLFTPGVFPSNAEVHGLAAVTFIKFEGKR